MSMGDRQPERLLELASRSSQSSADADAAFAVFFAEIAERIRRGEMVEPEEACAHHPEWVNRLRDLLPMIEQVNGFRHSVRMAASSDVDSSLGDFHSLREIGRGGMGIVYEAIQVSLNRRVALKILPRIATADSRKIQRFLAEAKAAACLEHPHIVPVHTVGCEDGVYYYAMQLIEGQTAAEVITRTREKGLRLTFSKAAELARQAAEALQFAHEHGVVHRDIKPSNLLIEELGWLWIADFGLARFPGASDLTETGMLIGTLRYMSPEQTVADRKLVDHRSDVYSLGATLYEMITLQPVHASDDRLELLHQIGEIEPTAPRGIDRAIPVDLETIVMKAIAKDPADRYATAGELAEDLGRFLDHRPVVARPPSVIGRASRYARRHRTAVTASALVALLAIVSLAVAAFWRANLVGQHNIELLSTLSRVERDEASIRRLLYASEIRLAQQEFAAGQVEFVQDVLERMRPAPRQPDPRGFEWYYLRRLAHRTVSQHSGHKVPVWAVAISPDERTLVSGDQDGVIIFWDTTTWRERSRTRFAQWKVKRLVSAPDGDAVAAILEREGERVVKLFDAHTGHQAASIPTWPSVFAMRFSNDGQALMVWGDHPNTGPNKVRVTFHPIARGPLALSGRSRSLYCRRVEVSRDSTLLATLDGVTGTITIRDPSTGEARANVDGRFSNVGRIEFSTLSTKLGVLEGADITVWDARSGLKAASPNGELDNFIDICHPGREGFGANVVDSCASPNGRYYAGGGEKFPATIWDHASGRKLTAYPYTAAVWCVQFTSDGDGLVFGSGDARVRFWRFAPKPEPLDHLAGHPAGVWALEYTPDGNTLISAADDATIKRWDMRKRTLRKTLTGHGALVTSLAVSHDGSVLASASFDKTLRLWSLPKGEPIGGLAGHTEHVRTVALSPDGQLAATGAADHTVRLWSVPGRRDLGVIDEFTDSIRALAFDPSGRYLVAAINDRTLRFLDPGTGRELRPEIRGPSPIGALTFSADGRVLAVGDDAGSVVFWDTRTWSEPTQGKGSDAAVWGLAFSPDGRTVAAACDDAKVRLWSPITGQVMLVLEGHPQRVNAVRFSPDGQTLASASHDGSIKLWQAEPYEMKRPPSTAPDDHRR